jgi:hypothetical protein
VLNEDQYMDRTPDLVAKVRKMREAAEREMNRFTRVSDYDVRRVVGQKPKVAPLSVETTEPSPAGPRSKKSAAKSTSAQITIEFAPAPAERGDDGENA